MDCAGESNPVSPGIQFGETESAAPDPMPLPLGDPRFSAEPKGDADAKTARIFVLDDVLADIAGFSCSAPDREVGGFLVGGYHSDGGREFVIVDRFLRARNSRNMPASMVFTHETFEAAWREIDGAGTESAKRIIGWHHTHPGYGAFLSTSDLFIHRSFFGQSWQIALVVDPKSSLLKFFGWRDGAVTGMGFVLLRRGDETGDRESD